MRWMARLKHKEGDKRIIMRFAWFPKRMSLDKSEESQVIWLESYFEQQKCYVFSIYGDTTWVPEIRWAVEAQ